MFRGLSSKNTLSLDMISCAEFEIGIREVEEGVFREEITS